MQVGFAAAAPWHDFLTRLFSFGMDGRWRRCCLDACELRPGEFFLDLATGTGELAIEAARRVKPEGRVVGLDPSRGMLLVARKKVTDSGRAILWVEGRAEFLPCKEEQLDCLTVGFALRHVTDLTGTLKEMVRVLKPTGRLGIVEFTRPEGAISRFLLLAYLYVRFVSTEGLRRSLEEAGLAVVLVQRHLAGSVSVCIGRKADLDHTASQP